MKKFITAYKRFLALKQIGEYRLCWIQLDEKGNGIYSVIEFFDDELSKIDKNKIDLIII